MFKVEIKRKVRKSNGNVSSTIKIIESDQGVSTRIIKVTSAWKIFYMNKIVLEKESWSELQQMEFEALAGIEGRINQIRKNMNECSCDAKKTISVC